MTDLRALQAVIGQLEQLTGRRYPNLLAHLTATADVPTAHAAACDLAAIARDVAAEVRAAERRGARNPWRHG